jgi:hypothetical protein
MADIDDIPLHDTVEFGSLEVTDVEGPPRQLPLEAYEVLEDGEHEYQGDDAEVQ